MSIRDFLLLSVIALKNAVEMIVYLIRIDHARKLHAYGGSCNFVAPDLSRHNYRLAPEYCLLLLITSSANLPAQVQFCDAKPFFNIPSQSLNKALLKFGAETKLTLLFSTDIVDKLDSQTVRGCLSKEEALTTLLMGSGLKYRFVDERTIALERIIEQPSNTAQSAPVQLEAIPVYGSVADERETISRSDSGNVANRYHSNFIDSATRTATPITNLPQSVQVANRNLLDDQQNLTLSESLINFSGVVPRSTLFTPVVEGTTIRGLRAEQLVDGFSQYYNAGDRESTVNIERIVVLKGANAVLYSGGAGATPGGLIDIVSKLPQPEPFTEAGFKFGSYDFFQPHFDWNQPLNALAALRITGEFTRSASHIEVIDTERYNINPSLSLTSGDGNTRLILQGKLSNWRQPEYQGLPATGTIRGSFRIRPETFIGPPDIPDSYSRSHAFWARFEHIFNQTWSINLRVRYAGSDYSEKSQTLVNRQGTIADKPLIEPSTWALINGELFQEQQAFDFFGEALARFELGASQNTLLLGGDRSLLDDGGYQDLGRVLGLVDLVAPAFKHAYRSPGPGVEEYSLKNLTYGGYLQLQSDVYRHIHTLFGLRLSGIDIDSHNSAEPDITRTETLKWLPRAGAVIDVTDNLFLFAGYNQGMRGQPYTVFSDVPKPAVSKQLEAGIKLEIADCLSGQLALYRIDRSQVAVLNPDNIIFSSRGKQRSQGFETDLTWHPADGVDVLASYAYTNAVFTDSLGRFPKNGRLAWIPEHSGRLWANYRFQHDELKGWSLGLGFYARSGAFLANDNQFATDGYHSFDATIAYETPRFRLAATAKNLSGEDYFQPYQYFGNGYSGGGRVVPGSGSSVFFSASVRY